MVLESVEFSWMFENGDVLGYGAPAAHRGIDVEVKLRS